MAEPEWPRIGYACISAVLRDNGIFCSRTVRLASVISRETGSGCPEDDPVVDVARLIALSNANIADLETILKYNDSWGCRFFRITSNLFPHMGNPKLPIEYSIDHARPELGRIGKWAKSRGMRLTMHPGQFAQLGAESETVLAQTVVDLTIHADILAALGYSPEDGAAVVIHGGGVYGDKESTLRRFAKSFAALPRDVSKYIVLENDEFNYSIHDLLPFCEANRIPLVVDFFHHSVWSRRAGGDADALYNEVWPLMDRVASTWRSRGLRPKCHYSEQKPGARDGAHSDCIERIPSRILEVAQSLGMDIMLEVKDKDVCARRILETQFKRIVDANGMIQFIATVASQPPQ